MNKKLIYQFSSTKTEGDRSMLDLLGGKGANLAEMSTLGINVPPGFTVTTEVCNYFIAVSYTHLTLPTICSV